MRTASTTKISHRQRQDIGVNSLQCASATVTLYYYIKVFSAKMIQLSAAAAVQPDRLPIRQNEGEYKKGRKTKEES